MLEIARTLQEKAKGFMGVGEIADDEAILFLNVGPHAGFHMKTVACDLTIAALDDGFEVLDISSMEAEVGGYTTPSGTRHVIEGNADLAGKLEIGVEPDWSMFGAERPDVVKKTAINAQFDVSAEMTKEIMRVRFQSESDADAPLSVTYLSELASPDFVVSPGDAGLDDEDNLCFDPKDATADEKYYGEDVGPTRSRSVMESLIDDVLGSGAAKFDGSRLLVNGASLEGFLSTIYGESQDGVRIGAARKASDGNDFEAILCHLDGVASVRKKRCGKSEESYLRTLRELIYDVG